MATHITAIEGNSQWLDGGAMFGNVPRALWESWVSVDALGRIPLACRGLLIEHDGVRVLCETGIGAFFDPKMKARFGVVESEHMLLKNLQRVGLSEDDIDVVILSHLHFDHAGGLLPSFHEIETGHDRLLFPNAKYVVGQEAFLRAESPHPRDRASFIPGLVDKLKNSNRLCVVSGDRLRGVLPPGVEDRLSFMFTHGHTPGHMHTIFRGDLETVFFAGDLIPGTAWVHIPITMGYDRYAELVIDEKTTLYHQAVPSKWLIFYTHDKQVALSRIELDPKGRYVPGDVHPDVLRYPIS